MKNTIIDNIVKYGVYYPGNPELNIATLYAYVLNDFEIFGESVDIADIFYYPTHDKLMVSIDIFEVFGDWESNPDNCDIYVHQPFEEFKLDDQIIIYNAFMNSLPKGQ